MRIATCIAVIFLMICINAQGQVQPANGASLSYTQVMFEHPPFHGAGYYLLHIYPSKTGLSPKLRFKTASPALLVKSGLSFGQQYQWHYEAWDKTKKLFHSDVFGFSTYGAKQADTGLYRFAIGQKDDAQIKDGLVFFDNPSVAVDRSGRVVWVMRLDSTENLSRDKVRNLHLTPQQTVMYLLNGAATETTLDGQPLWKAPSITGTAGVGKDTYHHDCRRLTDGSYLLCNYNYELEPCPFSKSDTCQVRYNTLLQMKGNGQLGWFWNEKGQVSKADIYKPGSTQRQLEGTHMNGFDFNEKEGSFIMSFRNNSRITKVDKKSGKLIWELQPHADAAISDLYFENQHGVRFTRDGGILVYNNSGLRLPFDEKEKAISWPTIILLKETAPGVKPTAVWEYECVSDAYPKGIRGKEGYAQEVLGTKGTNILVCTGGANRSFEVTPQKQVVWECFPTQYDPAKGQWRPLISYRNHFASSLYPFYLSIQPSSPKASSNRLGLTLFNSGSEDDSYIVELAEGSKQHFSAKEAKVNVKAGGSVNVQFVFAPLHKGRNPAEIQVNIRSQKSPAIKKAVSYFYR